MAQKMVIFGLIKALHDLFTALWIGGLLTTAISFMPAFKKYGGKSAPAMDLLKEYQRRLSTVALVSVVGLWITGLFLGRQSAAYGGFLNFSTAYGMFVSIKHLIVFVMILIAVIRRFVLGEKLGHFNPKQQKAYAGMLLANTVFGLAVLILSGLSAAFA
jgi:putative copper export protein